MPILYPLPPGTIVLCDYSRGGFQPPEMVKRRPALIISPRLPHRDGLCSVVPLSTTPPPKAVEYVVEINLDEAPPEPFQDTQLWAKCDMVATVSFARLEMFRGPRLPGGQRKYIKPKLPPDVFLTVQQGVLAGLGLPR